MPDQPMKHCTFIRDFVPVQRRGGKRILPAEAAARLVRDGYVAPDPSDFPPRPAASVQAPAAPEPARRRGRAPAAPSLV